MAIDRARAAEARAQVLQSIRSSLGRNALEPLGRQMVERRLAEHPRNLVPNRTDLPHDQQVDLFVDKATGVDATVTRVETLNDVPQALADYLKGHNLPSQVVMAPDGELGAAPWDQVPTLEIRKGVPAEPDQVSVTGALAGIAETGTLMMTSGPDHPSTLNFLPENHVVVMNASKMVGPYEDAWDRLRAHCKAEGKPLPRTVNLVTGPSRTGDIERRLELGAHGPRRLHIILVDGAASDGEPAPAPTGRARGRTPAKV